MTTSYDNDRTVIPSSERNTALDEPAHALPAGTQLAEFSVLSVIGKGGFGIVYLAYDHSLKRQVAIKEYMPSELAERTLALTVSVRSKRHAETFATGLRSFINEACLLAQFDHPCLLKVYRFWEANGTAYMAMPYHAGTTLQRTLRQRRSTPDEAWLEDLLRHLLDALEQMHEARCYHRDISPDNILIQPDGRPLLLDFGSARRAIGDMQRAFTVIVKSGYAPVEQYGEVSDMPDIKQGAWTDLYALGAVMYVAITGQTPPPAVQRLLEDKYVPLAQWAANWYSQGFLRAIDSALAVRPKDRPQSAAEMRTLLGWTEEPAPGPTPERPATLASAPVTSPVTSPVPVPSPVPATSAAPEPTAPSPQGGTSRRKLALASAAAAAAVIAAIGLAYLLPENPAPAPETARVQHRSSGSVAIQVDTAGAVSPTTAAASAQLADDKLLMPVPPSAGPKRAPPRVAVRAPPRASPNERRVVQDKPSLSRRCIDVIQRVSLGEPLTTEERDVLKQECGQ